MSNTKVDLLTIDIADLANKMAGYKEKNGEQPYALIIDNFTVWDVIAQLRERDTEAAEATILKGPDAFDDTPLRGMKVLVKIGPRRAELVNEATYLEEKTDG